MNLFRVRSLLLVTFAAALLAAGCGEGRLSSPTAPSSLPEATVFDADVPVDVQASSTEDELVALDRGRGQGGGGSDHDSGKGRGRDEANDNPGGRGNLSGFVTALGVDSITIRGVVVKITPTTVIRHGNRSLTLADITVGDHAQAKGTLSADGATMTASEVKVEATGNDEDEDEDEEEAEVSGTVAGLAGTCPALTFTVAGTMVKTDAATEFKGVACAALANGTTVEVTGTQQADGSVLASEVELELDELEGAIAALSGTCPSLTFTLGTTTVTTSASTMFSGVACAALANGTRVEVEGTLSGTTVAAVKVALDD